MGAIEPVAITKAFRLYSLIWSPAHLSLVALGPAPEKWKMRRSGSVLVGAGQGTVSIGRC